MKLAHSLKLSQLIEGTLVYNLSQNKTKKGEFSRSGGCFSVLIKKTANFSIVFLSSGKYCKFSNNCLASVGIVSNKQNSLKNLKKAGKSRWLNKRPCVRGVAMNPVDHKNGGGEGKKSAKTQKVWGSLKKKVKKDT